jgi:AcrR family transcriptional regulator
VDHNETEVSGQVDPRANQKARTKTAIVDAASQLVREGAIPTVATAAERARVSRATASRYFPTQEDLGEALTRLHPAIAAVDEVVDRFDTDDVEARVLEVVDTYNPLLISDQVAMRTTLASSQREWLRSHAQGTTPSVRSQTRMRWLDEVLRPLEGLPAKQRTRLRAALALSMGIESIVVMQDVCELDDREALAVLHWLATAVIQAATDGTI